MTIKMLLKLMGVGTVLHIGTEHGNGWIYSDTVTNLNDLLPDEWKEREIVSMYAHGGREESQYCKMLCPGIAVLVEGYENGNL